MQTDLVSVILCIFALLISSCSTFEVSKSELRATKQYPGGGAGGIPGAIVVQDTNGQLASGTIKGNLATLNPQFRLIRNPTPVQQKFGASIRASPYNIDISIRDVFGVTAGGITNNQYQFAYLNDAFIIVPA